MNIFAQLPEYGKELLQSLDPNHELDHLMCFICLGYFNLKRKRPIILCKNKTCAYQHGICEMCLDDMVKAKQKDGILEPLRCPYCKELGYENHEYDQSQNDLISKLTNIVQMLQHISSNTKKLTEEESQKKLKEIVDKAQRDIFNISAQQKKKSYLLDRLKMKIQSATKQSDKILKDVQMREKNLQQEQLAFFTIKQDLMIKQKQLENQMDTQSHLVRQLQQENRILKERLAEYQDITTLQRRVNNPHRQRLQRPNEIFNEDAFYTEFKFHPLRNKSFLQNFNELRPKMIIELKKEREKYFNAGERKIIFHSQIFDFNNEDNRLICFKVKSYNKNVLRYKFGLADQNYQQIKNANLFLSLDGVSEEQPFTITFYVNLVKMKLYATTSASIQRKCEPMGKNTKMGKFTVFVYFFDMKTQLTLD